MNIFKRIRQWFIWFGGWETYGGGWKFKSDQLYRINGEVRKLRLRPYPIMILGYIIGFYTWGISFNIPLLPFVKRHSIIIRWKPKWQLIIR